MEACTNLRKYWFPGLILQLLLHQILAAKHLPQRFANQPSPQTAVIGSTVVLPCRVINMAGELQWTRDGFGLGNERQLYAFKRYAMIGANDEGDYSLRISPVTLEDEAEFQCQVTGWKDIAGVRSQTAKLSVYVPPEPPTILSGPVVRATATDTITLECISKGGKPAAEIQWLDSSGRVVQNGVTYSKELLADGHRFDAKSILKLTASKDHHNAEYTCTATNPALHQPRKKQVRLEVTYSPVVNIKQDKPEGYREGEVATLTCSASANPNKLSFRWYRNGELLSNENQTTLKLSSISRDSKSDDITCEATNSVGSTSKTIRISVLYGPSFRVAPSDVYAEKGENVTLRCLVDGSPPPKIVWIPLYNSSFISGSGETLQITAGPQTVGKYMCLAKVEDFPEISANVALFLKVPPKVNAEKVQWGERGETSLLECFVQGATPKSAILTWTYKHTEITVAHGRYEIEKEITPEGLYVRLLVKDTEMEDFGKYWCSVENDFGKDQTDVILKRKKTLPMLMMVTGGIGGIVFIALIAVGLIILGRKRANKTKDHKKDLPEKNTTIHHTDQNSSGNESDLKVELDNRTGSSMSTKDPEMDHSWEKDNEHAVGQNYIGKNSHFMYPAGPFNGMTMKLNGHVTPKQHIGYTEFNDHLIPTNMPPVTQPQQMGYNGTGGFSPRCHPSMVTSSQLNLYPQYPEEYHAQPDTLEGLRGLSSTLNNGVSYPNYKNNNSMHPRSNGSPMVSTSGPNFHPIISSPLSASNTIPRLGIPVDSSQYIVPPRTQVLQGALATHV